MKLEISSDIKVWFTADTHYGHKNICYGTSEWVDKEQSTRPFKTLDHMNDHIVNNINALVGPDDYLFHLGDWSFGGIENVVKFREMIVCPNIFLILGNHDQHIKNNKKINGVGLRDMFLGVEKYMHLDLRVRYGKERTDKHNFILSHYPIASWENMNRGWIHLHGHTHLPSHLCLAEGKAMDVGIDGNEGRPYPLHGITTMMISRPVAKLRLPVDHHTKERT